MRMSQRSSNAGIRRSMSVDFQESGRIVGKVQVAGVQRRMMFPFARLRFLAAFAGAGMICTGGATYAAPGSRPDRVLYARWLRFVAGNREMLNRDRTWTEDGRDEDARGVWHVLLFGRRAGHSRPEMMRRLKAWPKDRHYRTRPSAADQDFKVCDTLAFIDQ